MATVAAPKGRMVVFGASGFIGGRICKEAAKQGYAVVGLSRTGRTIPYSVAGGDALGSFEMKTGDAADTTTYADELKGASAVVVAIGAPPVPNFLYKGGKQEAMSSNGTACVRPLAAASKAGVPRVVLVNASMPSWLKYISSGYYTGKVMSESATSKYASGNPTSAVVLKPSVVFGTRHVGSMHFPIPLSIVFAPLRMVMRIPLVSNGMEWLRQLIPSLFGNFLVEPVHVDELARTAVFMASKNAGAKAIETLGPDEIVKNSHAKGLTQFVNAH
eukprot:m.163076 g.163076  ORF g.163076 m.163076 type:complete len:274 (+) comp18095_c0_seq3:222-1043(+)